MFNKSVKSELEVLYEKLEILESFRNAIQENNNELACTISIDHSIDFIDDHELYELIVKIPDDAIYTQTELLQLDSEIEKLLIRINKLKSKT